MAMRICELQLHTTKINFDILLSKISQAHTKIHGVGFQLHKILKDEKLFYDERSQSRGYLGWHSDWKGAQQKFWGAGGILFLDLDAGYIDVFNL